MTLSNSHPAAFASWHVPAIAFFVLGLLAGVPFAVAAPVVAIRALGGVAMVAALLGIASVAYAARLENPRLAAAWRAAGNSLHSAIDAWRRQWAVRMQNADRYVQNAVWSAMG